MTASPSIRTARGPAAAAPEVPTLQIQGLARFLGGRVVLRDVSIEVQRGEVLALVAGNGLGKSTLLDCVAGVQEADAGTVRVEGYDVSAERADRRGVFYVPQSVKRYFAMKHPDLYCYLPGVSVRDNLLQVHGSERYTHSLDVDRRLQRFGLLDVAHAMPAELSVGMQQRLALARALSSPLPVLLLDEPLASVDRATRLPLLAELSKMTQDRAVIYVTHDPDEVKALGAVTITLDDGVARRSASAPDPNPAPSLRQPAPSLRQPAPAREPEPEPEPAWSPPLAVQDAMNLAGAAPDDSSLPSWARPVGTLPATPAPAPDQPQRAVPGQGAIPVAVSVPGARRPAPQPAPAEPTPRFTERREASAPPADRRSVGDAFKALAYTVGASALRGALEPSRGLPDLLTLLNELAASLEDEARRLRDR